MSVANKEISPINNLFNKMADKAGNYAEGLLRDRREAFRTGSVTSVISREMDDLVELPIHLVLRTVQGLASLSASITGGRKP